jgi:REP element-mobilizing transposase RayT
MAEYFDELYFLTATCNSWQNLILNPIYQKIILESLDFFTAQNYCRIYGFVIMPNHIHLIIGIKPENGKKFQLRFLKYTAQQIIRKMQLNQDPLLESIKSSQVDRSYQFWERRPKWISITHADMFWQKLNYIHNNPLQKKWNMVENPEDYTLSSAASYTSRQSGFVFLTLWDN